MDHLTREELRALLMAAYAHNRRDWLLLLVTYWHGLRVSETLKLTPADIRDGYITVKRLKGSLRTCQPLVEHSDPLLNEKAALTEYMAGLPAKQRLFKISRQNVDLAIKRYGAAAGIRSGLCHAHVLKHSIAMHSIATAGIENVKQYLGHKSLGSTGMYLKVSDAAASAAIFNALKV